LGRDRRCDLNKSRIGDTHSRVRQKGATPAQLEQLYRDRFEHFARVASAICGDLDLGRDVVQAAFMAAIRARRRYRGTGPLDAWVWRIVVREARRMGRAAHSSLPEGMADVVGNGGAEDTFGLRGWIAMLPERQREALFLRYYADLDYRAIADVLGIEVGTVSATLSAAHESLRKRLQEVKR
jgi:DNA-directed RNA polymerase specialized sigma24 family protein